MPSGGLHCLSFITVSLSSLAAQLHSLKTGSTCLTQPLSCYRNLVLEILKALKGGTLPQLTNNMRVDFPCPQYLPPGNLVPG